MQSDEIIVTIGQISNAPLLGTWDDFCTKYGMNPWCLNEGLAQSTDTCVVKIKDANFWGILGEKFERL